MASSILNLCHYISAPVACSRISIASHRISSPSLRQSALPGRPPHAFRPPGVVQQTYRRVREDQRRTSIFIHLPPGPHCRDDFQWVRPGASICLPFSWLAIVPFMCLGFWDFGRVYYLFSYRTVAWRPCYFLASAICPICLASRSPLSRLRCWHVFLFFPPSFQHDSFRIVTSIFWHVAA
ncbi:hypothetical protein BD311DRAFT_352396 [Dichomitus squalens]|uniref:Uncharacterized protein n=1 Tax=Dichomitus squalens TaxID=114155 RepID=A0A4Q9N1K2_9APHY|nr:hypothetical protein BD311DRAFT_352396 [Dichomitus squalens]